MTLNKHTILIFKALALSWTIFFLSACQPSEPKPRGETVYYQSCFSCHERGHGGAPKRGDKAAWEIRLTKSEAIILKHMKEGFNGMPPKGACFDCTDDDLKLALEFMLKQEVAEQ